ncbi:MAG TPA: hypothetical protein VEU72_10120 [Nitrosopumilaceae archaeon]|nr:hypothetical protein [Nitrosopumilaceae archaeon]
MLVSVKDCVKGIVVLDNVVRTGVVDRAERSGEDIGTGVVVIEDKIEGVDPFCSVVDEVLGRIGVIDTDGIVLKGCVMIGSRIVGAGAIRVGIVGSTVGIVEDGVGGSIVCRV